MNTQQRQAWEGMYRVLGQCLLHLSKDAPLTTYIHFAMEQAEKAENTADTPQYGVDAPRGRDEESR